MRNYTNKDMELVEDDPPNRTRSQIIRKGRGFRGETTTELSDSAAFDSLTSPEHEVQKSIEGWIIFVSGLHEETSEEDVHDAFADFGEIKNLHLNIDRKTGYAKGYALIEYESYKEAKNALETMKDRELLGKKMVCDWAFTKGLKQRRRSMIRRPQHQQNRDRSLSPSYQ